MITKGGTRVLISLPVTFRNTQRRRYQSPQFPACDFQEYAEGDQYQSAEELVGASEKRPDIGVAYLCQDIAEYQCDQGGKVFITQDFSPALCMFHVIYAEQFLEGHTADTSHRIQGSESQGRYAHGHKALGYKTPEEKIWKGVPTAAVPSALAAAPATHRAMTARRLSSTMAP